jgi:hypothetical protein
MEKQISRRRFLKKSAIALDTATVCDFKVSKQQGKIRLYAEIGIINGCKAS